MKRITPPDGKLIYWKRKLKKYNMYVDLALREVDVAPYQSFDSIPVGPRYYVNQLIKAGFNIQIKLF
ncbi:hypothetical protein [uncultured Sphingobacterium sp.]|uniref:hypothetical protein n=1 Tax=Sphingobacterium sp. HSC-15S19 TaxID=2910971 RepID=UPI0025DD2B57|nr:hypothetical protein [uncultured Sphingobacterium sp.]